MGIDRSISDKVEAKLQADLRRVSKEVAPPPNALMTHEQQAKRIELGLQKQCVDLKEKTNRGLLLCLARLQETSDRAVFVKEHLQKALLPLQSLETIQEYCAQVALGKSWKELLGVSEEVLEILFNVANTFLESGRYQEAEDAFSFLLLIDHRKASYWQSYIRSRSHKESGR